MSKWIENEKRRRDVKIDTVENIKKREMIFPLKRFRNINFKSFKERGDDCNIWQKYFRGLHF